MEYKQAPPELKGFVERAQTFWDHIDVDAMQPVIHGPLPTPEEQAIRAANLKKIQALNEAYELWCKAERELDNSKPLLVEEEKEFSADEN